LGVVSFFVYGLAKSALAAMGLQPYVGEANHRAQATYHKMGRSETSCFVPEQYPGHGHILWGAWLAASRLASASG
jgi:hypothetical protein